jgi:hypothetical protein
MLALFCRLSKTNALSYWACMVAIFEKWSGKWDKGEAGGREGWVGPLRRMVSSDRYHCDQGEKGNPMG